MTHIKCPECGLTNWSTEINCKRCKFVFQPETVSSIQKPSQPLPESSFADLYQPDYDSALIPSHSQTPQMAARMAAARQTANQPQNYPQPALPKTNNFQPQPDKFAPSFVKDNNFRPSPVSPMTAAKTKSGLAIASMILGILGFFTSIILVGLLLALVGLILGIVALVKANRKPTIYGGKGFAVAGIALSAIVVLFIPIVAAIAIPNLLAARRAANEGSAISSLKMLAAVEVSYMATKQTSRCGELQTLGAEGFIDSVLAKGEKNGYRFQIVNSPFGGCEITATPLSNSTGTRSFHFSTEDRIFRAAQKNGLMADKNDMPLN